MSAEDLKKAIKALDDDSIRARVAEGDLTAAGPLDLTEEEQALLSGAADDYPDVAGFAFDAFLKVDHKMASSIKLGSYNKALAYLKIKLTDIIVSS